MNGPIAAALAGQSRLTEDFAAFREAAYAAFGYKQTAMVRHVIAQVHACDVPGGAPLEPEDLAALADWRSSDRITPGQRTWLAYAARMPFEHTAIGDSEAAAVVAELGEAEYVAFTVVAALADAECRAAMVDLPALACA